MISIVICTFNRAPILQQTLLSFLRQNELNTIQHELLIIDNNSTDDTAIVVRDFLRNKSTKYFLETSQGLSFARNRGIAESNGELIAFLDDDVLVHKNWLTSLKACFDETDAVVVGGKVSLKFQAPPEKWMGDVFRKCLSEVDLGTSRVVLSDGDRLYGANLSFRKKVFEEVGPFDTNAGRAKHELLSGEETELLRRIIANDGRVIYDPDVSVEHLIGAERLQWEYFVKRATGDGATRELLEPKASRSFQILRVCNAAMELLKAGCARWAIALRSKDSYETRLAIFNYRRQRSYLAARFVRLINELGKH
jgi:glucosyl-dolichyl phosphate glucuronosyltransferase